MQRLRDFLFLIKGTWCKWKDEHTLSVSGHLVKCVNMYMIQLDGRNTEQKYNCGVIMSCKWMYSNSYVGAYTYAFLLYIMLERTFYHPPSLIHIASYIANAALIWVL